jgi:putative ABC transport system substrate-binding protein
MRRREFITLLGGAAIVAPRAAIAQTSSKVYRLGTLGPRDPIGDKSPFGAIIVRVLAQRGYTLGQTWCSMLAAPWAKWASCRTFSGT